MWAVGESSKDIYLKFLLSNIDYASHGIEHNEEEII